MQPVGRGGRKVSRPGGTSPRVRSLNNAGGAPPIQAMKKAESLRWSERLFLDAAEKGDKPSLQSCLSGRTAVNVNVTDLLGRTALEIAVDNENIEIVELLLREPGIRIGNALLCAIREGVYKLVEMLINHPSITPEMLGTGWTQSLDPSELAFSEYSSDVSPVQLAAHQSQFEILQLLLARGATIERPHSLSCSCKTCEKERSFDSLHHSLKRINAYRALASPAWICLTSADPVLSGFRLSWDLQRLASMELEFKDIYMQLSEQCKTFACDLLSQCRSTEEVIAILNKESGDNEYSYLNDFKLSLARLKLAIKYEQKQFVAHPHCQQLLTSIWYEGFPGRRERGSVVNIFVCVVLILLWPLLAICYIIVPKSRIGQIVRSPFMKFLYYSTSFGCFLLLLTLATFEEYRQHKGVAVVSDRTELLRSTERGPAPTLVEGLIFIWVMGMVWSEVKQLWDEGFAKYVFQWWNWLDFIMMSLYLATFAVRICAYLLFHYASFTNGPPRMPRTEWIADEPMLVAESLFAVANIFSFARIIYLFQTNPYLGPLQISLGCMLVDVLKFCFIFFLILSSFAIGLAQLYWYYDPSLTRKMCTASVVLRVVGVGSSGNSSTTTSGGLCEDEAFSSIAASYTTLLWSLFSITDRDDTEVFPPHWITEWIGRGMFIMYHVSSIIVLLNMLIAMMSHSFQIINDHADLEWKFHRTKLWMAHFDEGSSLQAPFNLIITPKSIVYAFRSVGYLLRWCCCGKRQLDWVATGTRPKRATIRRPGYSRNEHQATKISIAAADPKTSVSATRGKEEPLTYHDIMKRLVSRFIHHTKKEMKMDGVNEDDLLEIKQDISSLRYELRDDRRKEIQRSSSHIDTVKRDIMRTLSFTTSRPMPLSGTRRHSLINEDDPDEEDDEDDEPPFVDEKAPMDLPDRLPSPIPTITNASVDDFSDRSLRPDRLSVHDDDDKRRLLVASALRLRQSRTPTAAEHEEAYSPFCESNLQRARLLSACLPPRHSSQSPLSPDVLHHEQPAVQQASPCDECCLRLRAEMKAVLKEEFELLAVQMRQATQLQLNSDGATQHATDAGHMAAPHIVCSAKPAVDRNMNPNGREKTKEKSVMFL